MYNVIYSKLFRKHILNFGLFRLFIFSMGAKGDWDFQISDLVKNPDGTDI